MSTISRSIIRLQKYARAKVITKATTIIRHPRQGLHAKFLVSNLTWAMTLSLNPIWYNLSTEIATVRDNKPLNKIRINEAILIIAMNKYRSNMGLGNHNFVAIIVIIDSGKNRQLLLPSEEVIHHLRTQFLQNAYINLTTSANKGKGRTDHGTAACTSQDRQS